MPVKLWLKLMVKGTLIFFGGRRLALRDKSLWKR